MDKLLADAKKVLEDKSSTLDAINEQVSKIESIMQAAQQFAQQQAGASSGAGTPPPPPQNDASSAKKGGNGAVDADFEVVDDK